jgi:hypothetical protein
MNPVTDEKAEIVDAAAIEHKPVPGAPKRPRAGRRVLVSRRWSGKTLADHRADRKAWLTAMLDLPPSEPGRYRWERVAPADPDAMTPTRKLLHVLNERMRWRTALAAARQLARGPAGVPDGQEAA